MTDVLDGVRDHYRAAGLTERLKTALMALGPEDQLLTPEQLGALDQFHTRGLAATIELAKSAGITADMSVLDVGSGVGGPARFLAATYGCRVMGVDLSEPFVDAARYLTGRTGLSGQVSFQTASALELPDGGRFDAVLLQHVAMNIADRARLYREIRRVLKSGGRFATHDVVLNSGDPHYPVPWARTPATSFLLTAAVTRETIEPASFRALAWQDDSEAAKAWVAQLRTSGARPSPNLSVVVEDWTSRSFHNLGRSLAGRPARHSDRGVRGRVNRLLIGGHHVAGTPFPRTARLGLCRVAILPRRVHRGWERGVRNQLIDADSVRRSRVSMRRPLLIQEAPDLLRRRLSAR